MYVSKMQPFSARLYYLAVKNVPKTDSQQRLIGVARVLSGRIQTGQKIFVIGPNHTESNSDLTEVTVESLFLLMGS
jgi:translation elongation factor EF-G